MRDFRDAKAMAQTLRESLTSKAINISHSESLELVSKMLGVADWNTLSALLQAGRREAAAPAARPAPGTVASYPAIPIRDLVPFPTATYPLFVGREQTMQAVRQAWEREREVVLAIQRQSAVDKPGLEDLHEIGVLAQLLELDPLPDGTIKVVIRASRRVMIRRWSVESGAFQAEVAEISEGPVADAPDLVRSAIRRFEGHAAAGEIPVPDMAWFSFEPTRDPGRVADTIATRVTLPISDKYSLLATLDPVMRLERVDALVDLSARPFSPLLEKTRQRAFGYAVERKHLYATPEHFLLALIDDPHASVVLRACNAGVDELRTKLTHYLDNDLKSLVAENTVRCRPTAAFQRVDQGAALCAQEQGHGIVTGVHALLAIFAETRSPAARLLAEHGVSRARALKFVAQEAKTGS
jgi:ATP-dependent Lon protease